MTVDLVLTSDPTCPENAIPQRTFILEERQPLDTQLACFPMSKCGLKTVCNNFAMYERLIQKLSILKRIVKTITKDVWRALAP